MFRHAKGPKQVVVDQQGAQGQTTTQRLAEQQHVRSYAARLKREPRSGPAKTALDLIEDQQGPVFVGEPARLGHVFGREDVNAALAEDRFQKDCRRLGTHRGPKLRHVVAFHEADMGDARTEVDPVLILPVTDRAP